MAVAAVVAVTVVLEVAVAVAVQMAQSCGQATDRLRNHNGLVTAAGLTQSESDWK